MRIRDFLYRIFYGKKPDLLPTPESEEERTILCIDGGGMRGIVPLEILRKLDAVLKEKGFDKEVYEGFDMIAGTSTGGLISLCLTCSEKPDLDVLLESYLTLGKKIFPVASSKAMQMIFSVAREMYPSYGIEEVLKQWFGDKKLSCATIPTLIMAYDVSEGKPVLFSSWSDNPVSVFQAGRATSAAPTYFSPLIVDNHIYVDGGVVANNPSLYAYFEARKLWPDCKHFNVVSISTAATDHKMTQEQLGGLLSWVTQVSPMYSTAQKKTCDYVMNNDPLVRYYRIDGQPDSPVRMDETNPDVLQELVEQGDDIANDNIAVLEEIASTIIRCSHN